MKFDLLIVPNIYSADDKGMYDFYDIMPCKDYEGAIQAMKRDIKNATDEDLQKTIHYDIWEYDEKDNVINEWVFDCNGKEIDNFEEWLNGLTEEELKYFDEE